MPKWTIHDKWVNAMGVTGSVSSYVNSLIDFPERNKEYLDFCAQISQWSDYYDDRGSKWPFSSSSLMILTV